MRHEPLEALLPQPTRCWTASLQRGSDGTKARIQRSSATPTSPRTPMTITTLMIQATRNHDLQSAESHAQRLPRLLPPPSDTPELYVGQLGPLMTLSTAISEINDAQPQINHEYPSTFVDNSRHHASRAFRSPSAALEAAPVVEYWEWPFQGFLKRTRIGDNVTYELEFKLPSISEYLHLSIGPNALDIDHDAAAHSQIYRAPLKPKKSKWKEAEDIKLA